MIASPYAVRIVLFAAMLLLGARVYASDARVLAILPFDNTSGADAAPREVAARIAHAARERGWAITETPVEPLLEKERIRYFDSLEPEALRKVCEATGAAAVLTGTIYTFIDGRNPVVSVGARLISADGVLLWTQLVSVSSDDEEMVFGLRRASNAVVLSDPAVGSLMHTFPRPGSVPHVPRGKSKPLLLPRVTGYRAAVSPNEPRRVCILPFENQSMSSEAGRVVYDALLVRLSGHTAYDVVDPSELRAVARDLRVGSFRGIAREDLIRIGEKLGATLFVRGTIYQFLESAGGTGDPEIALELSMVDVTTGRQVWALQHERRGSDYMGLFMLGAVTSGVALADRAVSEIMEARGQEPPRVAQAFMAARTARGQKKKEAEKTSELTIRLKAGEKTK